MLQKVCQNIILHAQTQRQTDKKMIDLVLLHNIILFLMYFSFNFFFEDHFQLFS